MDIRIKFFKSILPDEGDYCVASISDKGVITQTFVGTVEHIADQADLLSGKGKDAYFALSAFNDPSSRSAANVREIRTLFLDIDVGEDKAIKGEGYPTLNDALSALRNFCKKYNLPKPTIVCSGYGLHVYWALLFAVPRSVWLPVATRLKLLCEKERLMVDKKVTTDAARILRVPFTNNYKRGNAVEVHFMKGGVQPQVSLNDFAELLGTTAPEHNGMDFTAIAERAKNLNINVSAVAERMRANRVFRFRDMYEQIRNGKGCAQLAYIMTNQQTLSEPLWRAGLSIAACCEDADKAAQKMSSKHPSYNWEETKRKMSQTKGAYHCTTFNADNPGICEGCPHWGKAKTPLDLISDVKPAAQAQEIFVKDGHIVSAAEADDVGVVRDSIPLPPPPYVRGENGGVYVRAYDPETETYEAKQIFRHDFYLKGRVYDREDGEVLLAALHLPNDGIREFRIPGTALSSSEEMRKCIGKHGVNPDNMRDMMEYLKHWSNNMIDNDTARPAHKQFGWTPDLKTFVLGAYEFTPNGVIPNAETTGTAPFFQYLKPKGSLEIWKACIDFFNKPGSEVHQFAICQGFGAPLMAFSGYNGLITHLHSKGTGHGKTTAYDAALSIMGTPEGLRLKHDDTYASRFNRAEVFKNILNVWDEMSNVDGKDSSDAAYQITDGRQRNRMKGTDNTERVRGASWHTLFGTTGNASLVDAINAYKTMPKAEAMRIFEIATSKPVFMGPEESNELIRKLHANNGHAGQIFLKHIVKLGEAELTRMYNEIHSKLYKVCKLGAEHRYWAAGIACTLLGGIIAESLGLIRFDMKAMFRWIVDRIRNYSNIVASLDLQCGDTLNDFYAEHINQILEITSTADRRNGQIDDFLSGGKTVRGHKLVARYETDTRKLFILVKPLRTWCQRQQLSYNDLVNELMEQAKARRTKVRIGKGTNLELPPAHVIEIPEFTAPEVDNVQHEEAE